MVTTTRHTGKARGGTATGGEKWDSPDRPLVASSKMGRPSQGDIALRDAQARQEAIVELVAALRYLKSPSTLSDLPICDREDVRQKAVGLRGYRYPRAHVVITAVRGAWDTCWDELGETDDASYLEVIADAIAGRSRRQSAERAGICQTEVSKRRRKGAEIIVDQFLTLIRLE